LSIKNLYMPERKEKLILRYLSKVCDNKKAHLVSPYDIAKAVSPKIVLSVNEIDEIMAHLALENYLDFVASEGKNGYYYCITLKSKGRNFVADSKKQKKAMFMLILRSIFLATVSFVFGIILKAIFKS